MTSTRGANQVVSGFGRILLVQRLATGGYFNYICSDVVACGIQYVAAEVDEKR